MGVIDRESLSGRALRNGLFFARRREISAELNPLIPFAVQNPLARCCLKLPITPERQEPDSMEENFQKILPKVQFEKEICLNQFQYTPKNPPEYPSEISVIK